VIKFLTLERRRDKMDLVAFGEAMIRLNPPNFERLEQTDTLQIRIGGAELNVAVNAARLGLKTAWVSRLPNNPLGYMMRNKAREHGVDTSHIIWTDEDRMGLYFLELGATPRASRVIYDRANSAISKIQPGEVKWDEILEGVKIFHTTGITPALSDSAAAVTAEALEAAKKAGCQITYDLNFRSTLWSREKAREVQTPFMDYIDILFTTEADTFRVFGIQRDSYRDVAVELAEKFGFKIVIITLRDVISVWRNKWTAFAYSEGNFYDARTYEVEVVDRVGGGDSCTAGFVSQYLTSGDIATAIEYGVAFSALKHSLPGDFNWCTPEEVEAQLAGVGLRISR